MAFFVRWLGQGGFEITDGNVSILLDPYLSDMVERFDKVKRILPAPIRPEDAHPDLYLITHDHMDHLDADTLAVMNLDGVHFAAPGSCVPKLVELGVQASAITQLDRGGALTFGGVSFKAVYAKHTKDSIGVLVSKNGLTAYFTGDTELDEDVGRNIRCDVLFVCINGRWGNMGIPEALTLAERVDAKLAIPNHYGLFAENTADPEPFLTGLDTAGRRGYRMRHGETFDLDAMVCVDSSPKST